MFQSVGNFVKNPLTHLLPLQRLTFEIQTKEEKKCFHVLKLAQPCYLMRIRKSLYDLGLSLCWLWLRLRERLTVLCCLLSLKSQGFILKKFSFKTMMVLWREGVNSEWQEPKMHILTMLRSCKVSFEHFRSWFGQLPQRTK